MILEKASAFFCYLINCEFKVLVRTQFIIQLLAETWFNSCWVSWEKSIRWNNCKKYSCKMMYVRVNVCVLSEWVSKRLLEKRNSKRKTRQALSLAELVLALLVLVSLKATWMSEWKLCLINCSWRPVKKLAPAKIGRHSSRAKIFSNPKQASQKYPRDIFYVKYYFGTAWWNSDTCENQEAGPVWENCTRAVWPVGPSLRAGWSDLDGPCRKFAVDRHHSDSVVPLNRSRPHQ